MGELRRLLIEPGRLAKVRRVDGCLSLTADESHYIKRVLRRRNGDRLSITDGCGLLWEAVVVDGEGLQLADAPCDQQPAPVRRRRKESIENATKKEKGETRKIE